MNRLRLLLAATLIGTLLAFSAGPALAAKPGSAAVPLPATGSFAGGTFDGTFTLNRFTKSGGALNAVGTLSGTLTTTANTVVGTVTNVPVSLPVAPAAITATCDILHLVLGPLDLNLLGLVVHLDQVVLDITAQSGPGARLGNLLCAVAHLLDGSAPLNPIVALLNQILQLLGG